MINNENVSEFAEILQEEEDLTTRVESMPLDKNTPSFIALRMTLALREKLDLRTIQLKGGDAVRIIESQTGAWFWLLLNKTHLTRAQIDRITVGADSQITNPQPQLWALAKPLTTLWTPKQI